MPVRNLIWRNLRTQLFPLYAELAVLKHQLETNKAMDSSHVNDTLYFLTELERTLIINKDVKRILTAKINSREIHALGDAMDKVEKLITDI